MKKILLLSAAIMVCMTSFGQFRVGLGLIGGLPSGDFGDVADFGIGGYIEPKISFSDIEVGLHLGGMAFAGADISGTSGSVSGTTIVPITANGYYFFDLPGVKPYVGAGLGPYFVDFGSVDTGVTGVPDIDGGSSTEFGFSPRAGLNLGGFDIGVAYHIVSDLNYFGFNLGFHIGKRAG